LRVSEENRIKDHRGAHIAFGVTSPVFDDMAHQGSGGLRDKLKNNVIYEGQNIEVDEQDYGVQKSLFFHDPDDNVLELTKWV